MAEPVVNRGTQLGSENVEREHYSAFGITVNPNISTIPGTKKHEAVHTLIEAVADNLFGTEDDTAQVGKLVRYLIPGEGPEKIIKWDEVRCTTEYGNNKWHIQAFVGIHHRTKVQLNIDRLRNVTASIFKVSPDTIHVNIEAKYKKDPYAAARDYPLKSRNAKSTARLQQEERAT